MFLCGARRYAVEERWSLYPLVVELGPLEVALSKMYQGADMLLDPAQPVPSVGRRCLLAWVTWSRYPFVVELGPLEVPLSKTYLGAETLLDPVQPDR